MNKNDSLIFSQYCDLIVVYYVVLSVLCSTEAHSRSGASYPCYVSVC